MLEHHADAAAAGLRRSRQDHPLAVPEHLAFARLNEAIDGFDQRRFSGTILAEKGVYLPWPDLDIDAVIGEEVAIALGQADRLKQRRFARMQVRRRI